MKATTALLISCGLVFVTACTTNDVREKEGALVPLTGDDLRVLRAGKTFEGRTSDGAHVRVYNTADGKLSASSRVGNKTYANSGTWEIKGNEVCNYWNNPDWKNGCWTASQRGDTIYFKPTTSGVPSTEGKLLDGNPYNL
jgi:hypothetical protein